MSSVELHDSLDSIIMGGCWLLANSHVDLLLPCAIRHKARVLHEPGHILQREDLDARGEEQLLYVFAAYAESTPRNDAGVDFAVGDADGVFHLATSQCLIHHPSVH